MKCLKVVRMDFDEISSDLNVGNKAGSLAELNVVRLGHPLRICHG